MRLSLTSIVAGLISVGVCLEAQTATPFEQSPSARPALIVLVMVDQFRADYVDQYGAQWTRGLRRLFGTGAYFRQAAYPYAATETCPGHTTVGTGAFPRTHGIIANGWYDRATKRPIVCTTDTATPVAIGGGNVYEQHGAGNIRTNTLADQLRAQSPGARVISLSLKARSAIGMAGHGGETVAWMEDSGSWASSTAYAAPINRAIDAFVRTHPIDPDQARAWNLLRPVTTYTSIDDGVAEQSPDGWTPKFPHSLARPNGPDRIFYDNWRRTPFGDQYLGQMAAVSAKGLGRGTSTDMLAVSFSALDYVGHRFGPASFEVQDTLARLDITLGAFFDSLDTSIGRGRYVVGMSSDHGVVPLPEQSVTAGLDAGRLIVTDIHAAIDKVLTTRLGPGAHFMRGSDLAGNASTDVYFTPAVLEQLAARPEIRREVADAAASVPGIARAVWPSELIHSDDHDVRAAALNFIPERSGDLLLIQKQYWYPGAGGTGHGTSYPYDQRVPVVLMGFGVRAGPYEDAVTPADIAPTLARLAGISLARVDGTPLTAAIK